MISESFEGCYTKCHKTSENGHILFSLGNITVAPDAPEQTAMYFQVKDNEGEMVANFALLPDSFAILMELIKEAFDDMKESEFPDVE